LDTLSYYERPQADTFTPRTASIRTVNEVPTITPLMLVKSRGRTSDSTLSQSNMTWPCD